MKRPHLLCERIHLSLSDEFLGLCSLVSASSADTGLALGAQTFPCLVHKQLKGGVNTFLSQLCSDCGFSETVCHFIQYVLTKVSQLEHFEERC